MLVGRRSIVVLVGALALAGAACSLFVSTDDLQGGDGDDGGSGIDATGDATIDVVDAGSSDARADADAALGPFCATHPGHAFCADFDESTDAAVGWTAAEITNATLDLDDAVFVSPPHSLESLNPSSTSNAAEARLGLAFDHFPKTVHLEMDAYLCDFSDGGTGYTEIFKLGFGSGFNGDGLELQFHIKGSAFVRTDAPAKNYFFSEVVPSNAWVHFVMDVAVGSAGSIKVAMNDVNVLDQEGIDTAQQSGPDAGYHGAVVGLYSNGAVACTSRIDNVIIDAN